MVHKRVAAAHAPAGAGARAMGHVPLSTRILLTCIAQRHAMTNFFFRLCSCRCCVFHSLFFGFSASTHTEFLDAVHEVAVSLQPVFDRRPELLPAFEVGRRGRAAGNVLRLLLGAHAMLQAAASWLSTPPSFFALTTWQAICEPERTIVFRVPW